MLRTRILVFSFAFLLFFVLFFVQGSQIFAYTFSQNLKIGITSVDVQQLQIFLNKDPDTQIAKTGVGSPGQESTYFGNLTKQAVVRFQNKYPLDILAPAGIFVGNGLVGPLTLKKLNSIQIAQNLSVNPSNNGSNQGQNTDLSVYKRAPLDTIDIYTTDKKIQAIQDSINDRINNVIVSHIQPDFSDIANFNINSISKVYLSRLSSQFVVPGETLTITGIGFNGSNDLYFGNSYVIQNIKGTPTTLSAQIPAFAFGRYDIVVKNSDGISNSMYLIIAPSHDNPVTVSSVTASSYGQNIVIHGTGFAPVHNDIVTSLGIIKDVPSPDGLTLSTPFTPAAFREISKAGVQHKQYPVTVSVISDKGYSDVSGFLFSY